MQPPSTRKVVSTPDRLARGKYLFMHVANCADCHSDVHFDRFATPIKEGGLAVGRPWPAELGLPGTFYSPNITSDPETGVGAWTDGELSRAIREGIGRDGRVLFPLMPYGEFRNMSDDDTDSIVACGTTRQCRRSSTPACPGLKGARYRRTASSTSF